VPETVEETDDVAIPLELVVALEGVSVAFDEEDENETACPLIGFPWESFTVTVTPMVFPTVSLETELVKTELEELGTPGTNVTVVFTE
jgi:hypothetical protein